MARLITTKAERAAHSFLNWDDAALGRYCKKLALTLRGKRQEQLDHGKANDDIDAVINAADGMLMVSDVVAMNAASATVMFGDFTRRGQPAGDWEIRIKQLKKPKS